MTQKQLHLNAFLMEAATTRRRGGCPSTDPGAALDVQHYVRLAQLAEAAKFDSIFLADGSVAMGTGECRAVRTARAADRADGRRRGTERIGLIATASTTYNEPYNLARRLASVDHVSKRTRRLEHRHLRDAGARPRNFCLDERPLQATRYERADEFLDVAEEAVGLAGATTLRRRQGRGRWGDPDAAAGDRPRRHALPGRRAAQRPAPPQGYPLLVQAGASEQGKEFAAKHAEAIFVAHQTLEQGQDFYADIKAPGRGDGRNPDHVLVLPGLVPIIGATEAEATEKAQQLEDLRVPEYGLRQLAMFLDIDEATIDLDAPLPRQIVEQEDPRRLRRAAPAWSSTSPSGRT